MIPITYDRIDGIQEIFESSIVDHPPINPESTFAVAETGGEGSPVEITYKGSRTVVTVMTKPLNTIEYWPAYKAFLDATEKRQEFIVDARLVPLVDVEYVAFRLDRQRNVQAKHGNRFFVVTMQLQLVRIF